MAAGTRDGGTEESDNWRTGNGKLAMSNGKWKRKTGNGKCGTRNVKRDWELENKKGERGKWYTKNLISRQY